MGGGGGDAASPGKGRCFAGCLQDFFDRHDDELHAEFRHIRNALDAVLGSLRFAEKIAVHSRQIAALASVHRLLRTKIPSTEDPAQMPLF